MLVVHQEECGMHPPHFSVKKYLSNASQTQMLKLHRIPPWSLEHICGAVFTILVHRLFKYSGPLCLEVTYL